MTVNVYNPALPCVAGTTYTFPFALLSQADTKIFKTSPTLAAGDFVLFRQASGTWSRVGNLTTTPALIGISTRALLMTVLDTELPAGTQAFAVMCSDAAGAEWCDLLIVKQLDSAVSVGTGDLTAADFFSVDSGETYQTAVAGSVVKEIVSNAAGTGAGAFTITNTIDDGTNPIDGVQVRCATDSAFSNVIATDVTDTDGNFTFYLDAGTYYVRAQLAGYNFSDKTLTVTANGTGTLS